MYEPELKREKARQAIDLARRACGTNRFEFERRYVDAEAAIRELDPEEQNVFEAAMENDLRLVGCKPP